jgi:hypothetical protein
MTYNDSMNIWLDGEWIDIALQEPGTARTARHRYINDCVLDFRAGRANGNNNMGVPVVETVELRLPLTVVEPTHHYGTSGGFRIVDADHRVVCEVLVGGREMAEMIAARMI